MDNLVVEILKKGGIGILPTDTIYGVVGRALEPKAVERIYQLRERNPSKPMIILIGRIKDLKLFEIEIEKKTKKILKKYWPGKVSIILPCPNKKFAYLHRGTNSLAFRWPDKPDLVEILKQVGPMVAPSANPEGESPAKTIDEAKKYFGQRVDFYLDEGELTSLSSTLISVEEGKIAVKREGAVKIPEV